MPTEGGRIPGQEVASSPGTASLLPTGASGERQQGRGLEEVVRGAAGQGGGVWGVGRAQQGQDRARAQYALFTAAWTSAYVIVLNAQHTLGGSI